MGVKVESFRSMATNQLSYTLCVEKEHRRPLEDGMGISVFEVKR